MLLFDAREAARVFEASFLVQVEEEDDEEDDDHSTDSQKENWR